LEEYSRRFERTFKDIPLEITNWRLTASIPRKPVSLAFQASGEEVLQGRRDLHLPGFGRVSAKIVNRYALSPGMKLQGPAIFEERESSFAIGPDCRVEVDNDFNLVAHILTEPPVSAGDTGVLR